MCGRANARILHVGRSRPSVRRPFLATEESTTHDTANDQQPRSHDDRAIPYLARTRSTFRTPVELVARHLMITKVGGGRFTDVRDEIVGIAINMNVWTRVKLAEQAMS
jgi:hypothetical protein